jgi:hypothetical protein
LGHVGLSKETEGYFRPQCTSRSSMFQGTAWKVAAEDKEMSPTRFKSHQSQHTEFGNTWFRSLPFSELLTPTHIRGERERERERERRLQRSSTNKLRFRRKMTEESSEDWLPPGWTVEVRVRKHGKRDKVKKKKEKKKKKKEHNFDS